MKKLKKNDKKKVTFSYKLNYNFPYKKQFIGNNIIYTAKNGEFPDTKITELLNDILKATEKSILNVMENPSNTTLECESILRMRYLVKATVDISDNREKKSIGQFANWLYKKRNLLTVRLFECKKR